LATDRRLTGLPVRIHRHPQTRIPERRRSSVCGSARGNSVTSLPMSPRRARQPICPNSTGWRWRRLLQGCWHSWVYCT